MIWLTRFVTALSLFGLGACASVPVQEYGRQTVVAIVGGFACDPAGLEAVGALVTADRRTICSGTLITSDTVLTAAHCLEGEDPSQLLFTLGPEPKKAEGRPIESWVQDPRYTGDDRGAHDIALVQLREPVPGVAPLRLRRAPLPGTFRGRLTFVGYGRNQGATNTGMGVKRCLRIPISQVDDDTFIHRTRGSNSCHGDSGGPVLDYREGTWEIVGVISSGDSRCERIGFNARVDVVAAWIEQMERAARARRTSRQAPMHAF